MNFKQLLIPLTLLPSIFIYGQSNFYSIDSVTEIKLYFQQSNWKHLLDSFYVDGSDSRILANIIIDGNSYDSVGVRYKGYSSVNTTQTKNPFNLKLDHVIEDQHHDGYNKIKLSNVIHDPSFIRETLSYKIARQYMPASEANFANVYINDTLWGLYSNVEAVNKDFLEKHYNSRSNTFFKCNPASLDLYGENSNLSDSPGTDSLSYEPFYDIESDYGWSDLFQLIDTLNNYPNSIENILNVDQTLWMHAFNYSIINFDSYIGYSQNYYLYKDHSGRFNPILWDLNMSFGSFRLTDASSYFNGFSISQAIGLDPLTHYNDVSVFPRPLMRNLFNDDSYRKMYLAHLKTIVEENFSNQAYVNSAISMQQTINQSVINDTNKFYSYTDFQNNLNNTVNNLIDYPGITTLMNSRASYLMNYPGINYSPTIDSVKAMPININIGDDLTITAEATNTNGVYLYYRNNSSEAFQKTNMYDNGLNDDGIAGDDLYGAKIVNIGNKIEYYIYAENDSTGKFSPDRAAFEFYTVNTSDIVNEIVINELVAINDNVIQNNIGEFSDWIELYNLTSSNLSMGNLYLSDDISELQKWSLPNVTISANDYFIIWADAKSNEGINHANFKLKSQGEALILSNSNGLIIDSITYPVQSTNVAYARLPNGTGTFTYATPSFNYNNDFASIKHTSSIELNCFPNPFSSFLHIEVNNELPIEITVVDLQGKTMETFSFSKGQKKAVINTAAINKGVYFLKAKSINNTTIKKLIKI